MFDFFLVFVFFWYFFGLNIVVTSILQKFGSIVAVKTIFVKCYLCQQPVQNKAKSQLSSNYFTLHLVCFKISFKVHVPLLVHQNVASHMTKQTQGTKNQQIDHTITYKSTEVYDVVWEILSL